MRASVIETRSVAQSRGQLFAPFEARRSRSSATQLPQPVPAPQRWPISPTVRAPSSIIASMSRSEAGEHMQTIMRG